MKVWIVWIVGNDEEAIKGIFYKEEDARTFLRNTYLTDDGLRESSDSQDFSSGFWWKNWFTEVIRLEEKEIQ